MGVQVLSNFYRTMHYSAKRGLAIACLSVRLSVTLVHQDRIRWKSWKLIARTITSPRLHKDPLKVQTSVIKA